MNIQREIKFLIGALLLVCGLVIGLVAGLYIGVSLPASALNPTATPDNCFRTANYQGGQIVSYGHRCVPVTP